MVDTQRSGQMLATAHEYKHSLLEKMFGRQEPDPSGSALHSLPYESGVVGVGYGSKHTSGAAVSGMCAVRVYVRSKRPKDELSAAHIVPSEINGMPTDVMPIGDVFALTGCGDSIGHPAVTAGTLGCLVTQAASPDRYILSNNHVLANADDAKVGDIILAPGKMDGGAPPPIANLTKFLPIKFRGENIIDAAIAKLIDGQSVAPVLPGIGHVVNPAVHASLHQSVRKVGRSSGQTVGVITDLSASIKVQYGVRVAAFEDQIAITGVGGAFAFGGDSGSLIVDAVTLQPVALLFAGANGLTFANPIDKVLAEFNVSIVGG